MDIIAVEIGATITLEEVTSKAMAVDQYGIISTLEEDLHPMVLIWVLVADNPETRDGYHPSVDKVLWVVEILEVVVVVMVIKEDMEVVLLVVETWGVEVVEVEEDTKMHYHWLLPSCGEPTTCLLVASTSVLFSIGAGRAIRLETRPGRTIRIQDREASS